jgi:hypothetical protein
MSELGLEAHRSVRCGTYVAARICRIQIGAIAHTVEFDVCLLVIRALQSARQIVKVQPLQNQTGDLYHQEEEINTHLEVEP